MTPIEKIKEATIKSPSPLLDTYLLDPHHFHKVSQHLCFSKPTEITANVLLANILTMHRQDMRDLHSKANAWTWRTLLKGIEGEGWNEKAFGYFDNRIAKTEFNQPGSSGFLDLTAYGSAVACINGAHRMVAAYCWLVATKGDSAFLKEALFTYYRPRRAVIEQILSEAENGVIQFIPLETQLMDEKAANKLAMKPVTREIWELTSCQVSGLFLITKKNIATFFHGYNDQLVAVPVKSESSLFKRAKQGFDTAELPNPKDWLPVQKRHLEVMMKKSMVTDAARD